MMSETLKTLAETGGAAGLGALITAWLHRRKDKVDIDKTEAETKFTEAKATLTDLAATEKAIGIYKELAEDLKSEVDTLRALVVQFREENQRLQIELTNMRAENDELIAEIKKLHLENRKLLA